MNPERKEILNLISLPGRMNAAEAAWRLGFEPDHIPILVTAGQLNPRRPPKPQTPISSCPRCHPDEIACNARSREQNSDSK